MIEIFKVNNCFAHTAGGHRMIGKDKNLRKFAEIIFSEVKAAKRDYGREEKISFPKRIFIEHEYPKKPRLFSDLTKREIKKFWSYYKKLAEAAI